MDAPSLTLRLRDHAEAFTLWFYPEAKREGDFLVIDAQTRVSVASLARGMVIRGKARLTLLDLAVFASEMQMPEALIFAESWLDGQEEEVGLPAPMHGPPSLAAATPPSAFSPEPVSSVGNYECAPNPRAKGAAEAAVVESRIDAARVKEALAGRMLDVAFHLFPNGRKIGREFQIGGLDGGSGSSLCICVEGAKAGTWSDFAESDKKGGPLDLWMQARNLIFVDALREAAGWLGGDFVATAPAPRRAKAGPPAAPAPMPREWLVEASNMALRLAGDADLCKRIAEARNWRPETLRELALGGVLGWHENKLGLIYQTGIKLRWQENGERVIRFLCGNASELWRGWMLTPSVRKVYVTEGETDAITMIDAGAESSSNCLVVALPSASTIPVGAIEALAGKEVVLCLDLDAAGRIATDKLMTLLRGKVVSLKIWKAHL